MVVTVKIIQYYLTLIMLVSMTCINAKATPTNHTNYSCHIKTIELVLINDMDSISCHIILHACTHVAPCSISCEKSYSFLWIHKFTCDELLHVIVWNSLRDARLIRESILYNPQEQLLT